MLSKWGFLPKQHAIQVSMSGVGNCYDNAMMESFFATRKTECVTERFDTRQQARQISFEYIEVWYNRLRGQFSSWLFESRTV